MAVPNLIVRTFQPSDLRAYVSIRLQALRDHPAAFGSSYEDQVGMSEEGWLSRAKFFDGQNASLFVADAGQELAGILGVYREAGSKIRHSGSVIQVYVRPAYRGQRLVDELFSVALDWCRTHDVTVLRLTVNTSNTSAIRCYERLGLQTTGTQLESIRTADGVYHDEYLMSRRVK